MRLWHKNLIKVLPRKQLISQWRECCCIAKNLAELQTPNHILVNKLLDYPLSHFVNYTNIVIKEMENRNYNISEESLCKYKNNIKQFATLTKQDDKYLDYIDFSSIFKYWHNKEYYLQCYYNLQEKYHCSGIDFDEWVKIEKLYTVFSTIHSSDFYF